AMRGSADWKSALRFPLHISSLNSRNSALRRRALSHIPRIFGKEELNAGRMSEIITLSSSKPKRDDEIQTPRLPGCDHNTRLAEQAMFSSIAVASMTLIAIAISDA